MIRPRALLMSTILVTLLVGCSDGSNNTPLSPADQKAEQQLTGGTSESPVNEPYIWGYYSLVFDLENGKVEVVPCRSVEFTANVVKFLNSDPQGLKVKINKTTPGTGYVDLDMDITIKHPLPQAEYNGYDVRGVFVGNGSEHLTTNADLIAPATGTDQMLLNADGYTRWFNPAEFPVPKIFGYIPGKLASKGYTGTATLNPYKYFGEGLGAADNLWDYFLTKSMNVGYFLAGTSNTRNYKLHFPIPSPGIKYGYVVTANWAGTKPQFHPSHAPEAVGVKVADNSDLWFVDDAHKGGNLKLDIDVFDWDAELTAGVMQDYQINVESSVLAGPYSLTTSDMTPTATGTHWFTYHVEIPADNLVGVDDNEMWVVVEDAKADYTNPMGVPNTAGGDKIAACYRYPVIVSNVEPSWVQVTAPNGGETWEVYDSQDITWTASTSIANVKIELSLDSGASYAQVISATPNDGTFTWDSIPPEAASDTCRIRISDAKDASVNDRSDDDFIIHMPGILVTNPNGGEVWKVGGSYNVTWEADPSILNVKIEVSEDSGASYPMVVVESTPNDGSCDTGVIPPEAVTDHGRVKISDVENPLVNDESDADYVVYQPWLNITSPNGGEEWQVGSSHEITWECSETGGTVSIVYTKDNFGSDINEITADTPNDGSFMWDDIPDDVSDTVKVGIDLTGADPQLRDSSDDNFSIVPPPPSITVVTPNGGEALRAGDSYEITWTSINMTDPVNIYYSEDNFQSDINTIVSSTPNTGSFMWDPIPFDLSDTVRIKVESSVDAGIYDVSDTDFSLEDNGWADTWGGSYNDYARAVATDDNGNTFAAGDLGTSYTSQVAFLNKYNPMGAVEWSLTWGSQGNAGCGGVATDSSGNVYVTGGFTGTNVDFDPGPGTDLHSADANGNIFVSKFGPSGNFVWARTWGGYYDWSGEGGKAIAVDNSVYVAGLFTGTNVDFDPRAGTSLHSSVGGADAFLSNFDTDGNFIWAGTWGGNADPYYGDEAHGVAIDDSGNVYVTGYFLGSNIDFDPDATGTSKKSSNGDHDIFLSWFDSSHNFLGVWTWGGTGYDSAESVDAGLYGVSVTGYFESASVDFDPGSGTDTKTLAGGSNPFLSRFDTSVNYEWSRTWGSSGYNISSGVSMDDSGNAIVAGYFSGSSIDFDPGAGTDLHSSNGQYDAFFSEFDSSGNYVMARTWGGSDYDTASAVCVTDGRIFVVGYFMSDGMEFAPTGAPCYDDSDTHSAGGTYNAFLSKYMPDGCW